MKKRKKKLSVLQMGGDLVDKPLLSEDIEPEKIIFNSRKEFDNYYKNKAIQGLSPEDKLFYNDILSGKITNIDADSFIALRNPTPRYEDYIIGKKKPEKMGNVLGRAYGVFENGGIIDDNMGQWKYPGKKTRIKSNKITMKNVPYPVLGVSDTNDMKIMYPEQDYIFDGNEVVEYPIANSGIHIKESKKGTFTKAAKKRGKGVQQFASQVLSNKEDYSTTMVKKAVFAKNSKKWRKGQNGTVLPDEPWYGENFNIPQSSNIIDQLGGGQGILDTATSLVGGIQQIRQDKDNKDQARQFYKLAKLVNKASSLPVDKPERKYVRPEDNILDPNSVGNSYGVGTTYLEDGGKVYQLGGYLEQMGSDRTGNIGQMFGSVLGGGQGSPSGAGQVGSTLGTAAGTLLGGPVGGAVGSFIGGTIGGLLGGKTQKLTRRYQRRGEKQLQNAAFQQGAKSIHNQYTGFMKNGGDLFENYISPEKLNFGGELKVYDGDVEQLSENPYSGETIEFKGKSHDDGGIMMSYGNNKVEVEGGEPAVKMEDNSMVVYGNMKIPSYGVTELNDPKAKGKKFKSYIKDLSKQEEKQNNIIDKQINIIDDTDIITPFDKLKISSAEAMLEGANMKLKNISKKKQIAANVQNAILETAEEFNLSSDELAKGNIKKEKKSSKKAQDGRKVIPSSEVQSYLDMGYEYVPEHDTLLRKVTNIPGQKQQAQGSVEFNKWFKDNYNEKTKGKVLDSPWGPKLMALGQRSTPDRTMEDYVAIYDPTERKPKLPLAQVGELDIKPIPTSTPTGQQPVERQGNFDVLDIINAGLPWLRPSNQLPLDPNQLSGEMLALASNELEPVQAQLYQPLLEQVTDISLQDQLNANQADFNTLQRTLGYNPEAQSALAAQKYTANTNVLGEQFRLNQNQRLGTYNRNRQVLNDATLKNLAILDQQYERQSKAKSNTKETARAAISSIADKIAKNKLENRTLGIYENLYNYRFGPKGYAYNLNPLAKFDIPTVGEELSEPLSQEIIEEMRVKSDRFGNRTGSESRKRVKTKKSNGGLVKYLKY